MKKWVLLIFVITFFAFTSDHVMATSAFRVCTIFPAGCTGNGAADTRAQCCPAPGGVPALPEPVGAQAPPTQAPPTQAPPTVNGGAPPPTQAPPTVNGGAPPPTQAPPTVNGGSPPPTQAPPTVNGGFPPPIQLFPNQAPRPMSKQFNCPGSGGGLSNNPDNCPPPQPPCQGIVTTSDWGTCEGAFTPWDTVTHTREFVGAECQIITATNTCGGGSTRKECRPCGYTEIDEESPSCESVVDWEARPLESIVLSCEDDLSGCDEGSYQSGAVRVQGMNPTSACDRAGNCTECEQNGVDETPPTCTATFLHPERWHRDDSFEIHGGRVRCWLENCEDIDEDGEETKHVSSGCLPFRTLENTPKIYNDPGGMIERIQVEQDSLDPVHRDTCMIQVCDNAGNCNTCTSPEIAYDGTNLCRASDGNCRDCAEDDWDCLCISGEQDKCTNSGPVNCYVDPFNERCPGFENEACLSDNFIPGCPLLNPCYPEANREHPQNQTVNCPDDAIRFCSRNPYHYGCNEACKFGLIECDPDVPDGVE